jgi:hypothetical protein
MMQQGSQGSSLNNIHVFNFQSRTVRLDNIKVFYLLMYKRIGLKELLKFTLKHLQHVSA